MILINLLPHREAARKRQRDVFYVSLGLSALIGVLLASLIFLGYQAKIGSQLKKINFYKVRSGFLMRKSRKLRVWTPRLQLCVRVSKPWKTCRLTVISPSIY